MPLFYLHVRDSPVVDAPREFRDVTEALAEANRVMRRLVRHHHIGAPGQALDVQDERRCTVARILFADARRELGAAEGPA
jgi:hypothetical protein